MCRKLIHHRPCGHVTAKYQHRPCKNGQYCPRITQELNSSHRCPGCKEDDARIIERPALPADLEGSIQATGNATDFAAAAANVGKDDENLAWYKRFIIDRIFDDSILVAQLMDHNCHELRDSRERRAERVKQRGCEMDVHEADSFKWVPKKWWKNIFRWRTRPAMYIDGENGHHKLCGCCQNRRVPEDEYRPVFLTHNWLG